MPWRARLLALLVLVAAIICAYWPGLTGPFVLDDFPTVQQASTMTWNDPASILRAGGRRALGIWTFALNLQWNPTSLPAFHLVNLSIHITNVLLLLALVYRTLQLPQIPTHLRQSAFTYAWLIAALWGLHPINTQAVTYIAQRAESLMALTYLLTLYCFHRYATALLTPAGHRWALGALVSCAAGMCIKEVMLTAPVAVLLYDYCFLAGHSRNTILARLRVHALLFLTMALIPLIGWSDLFPSATAIILPEERASAGLALREMIDPWHYLLTQTLVLLRYVRVIIWPDVLVFDYGWSPVNSWRDVVPQGLIVCAWLLLTFLYLWCRPLLGFVLAWFFVILAPTSSVIPVLDVAAEHRAYLASISLIVLGVLLADFCWRSLAHALRWDPRLASRAGCLAMLLVVASLAVRTFVRNGDYRSALKLWHSSIVANPYNPRAYHNLGAALYALHNEMKALECYEREVLLFRDALWPHNNLANSWVNVNQPNRALYHLQRAQEIAPGDPTIQFNLGRTLMLAGRFDDALASVDRAIARRPAYPEAHNLRGAIQMKRGEVADAQASFAKAITLTPDVVEYHLNFAAAALAGDVPAEAVAQLQRSKTFAPHDPRLRARLIQALLAQGDFTAARAELTQAQATAGMGGYQYLFAAKTAALDGSIAETLRLLSAADQAAGGRNPELLRARAWVSATAPADPSRPPVQAVELAQSANRMTGNDEPLYLDTLAAASAAAGYFDDALAAAQRAIDAAQARGLKALVARFTDRRNAYQRRAAYQAQERDLQDW